MFKFALLLIFAAVLFGFFISEPFNFAKEKTSVTVTPTPPNNSSPKIKKINLSKSKIILPCPPGTKSPEFCSDDFIIDVQAETSDADNDVLDYKYTISGGKIIGQGAKVVWDLSGVRLGIYELTAAVEDDCGFRGESKNMFVEVKECDGCHGDCVCPTISVIGPANILPDEPIDFTANVSGGGQVNVTYKWTVEKGKIIKGQGTPVVEILPETSESIVTATVEIGGLCEECVNIVSESAVIIKN